MQVVVEYDTDGETQVTFICMDFHSVACSSIQLYEVPFNSVQFIQLTTQLEIVKLCELMEGAYLPCGR